MLDSGDWGFAGMIGREPVLQTDFKAAVLAGARVGECEQLFAALNRAFVLLFLCRITVS